MTARKVHLTTVAEVDMDETDEARRLEIERARDVLAGEREAVLSGLRQERSEAERAAAVQREWRRRVESLLERGRLASVPVADMAEALGVSRQWTSHLLAKHAQRVFPGAAWPQPPRRRKRKDE